LGASQIDIRLQPGKKVFCAASERQFSQPSLQEATLRLLSRQLQGSLVGGAGVSVSS
jgi:hypothetical protein